MTEQLPPHESKTHDVLLVSLPARESETSTKVPSQTFKDASEEQISSFVEKQAALDEEQKEALKERLITIQNRLKNKQTSEPRGL